MHEEVLLVDMGNSRTKTARWCEMRGVERVASWSTDQLAAAPADLWERPWLGAVISSVASIDSLTPLLDVLDKQRVPTMVISSELIDTLGLLSGLYPGQGADRVANVVALSQLYRLPALCVDMGTAITFDLVDDRKQYVGGLIAPGPTLMTQVLANGTARLPRVEESAGASLLGAETVTAISRGCWWGGVALINGLLIVLSKRNARWQTLVTTGGICEEYSKEISFPHVVDIDITFKGMALVWQAGNARPHTR
jgi:pantothenate kinase type III